MNLQGRVAVVTGGGRGIGREHSLLLAKYGARVVVNDLAGSDEAPADAVVEEIRAAGGEAVANYADVSDEAGAQSIIDSAIETFGRLDIVINNAGILRDKMLVNLEAAEWDVVVKVNLRGTFLVTRAAGRYWRTESKEGRQPNAVIVSTSSESGVFGNPGQANYAAAKSAIATLMQVASKELGRYGVRANAILPQARTRLTEAIVAAPKPGEFDRWDAANVAPFVVYLSLPTTEITGEVFLVGGSRVLRVAPWTKDPSWKLEGEGKWTVEDLEVAAGRLGVPRSANWTANPDKAR